MDNKTKYSEPADEVKTEAPKKDSYRYYCEACTGVAFYTETLEGNKKSVCVSCGKPLGALKKENFIKTLV